MIHNKKYLKLPIQLLLKGEKNTYLIDTQYESNMR